MLDMHVICVVFVELGVFPFCEGCKMCKAFFTLVVPAGEKLAIAEAQQDVTNNTENT